MFSWLLFTYGVGRALDLNLDVCCDWLINQPMKSIHENKAKNEEASICWQCFVFHPCILLRLGFKQLIYYHKMSFQDCVRHSTPNSPGDWPWESANGIEATSLKTDAKLGCYLEIYPGTQDAMGEKKCFLSKGFLGFPYWGPTKMYQTCTNPGDDWHPVRN